MTSMRRLFIAHCTAHAYCDMQYDYSLIMGLTQNLNLGKSQVKPLY